MIKTFASHSPLLHNTDSFVKGTFTKDFCLEVLARLSLSHDFVLPLLGIFVDKMQPFFVSPYMKGTLTSWRKTRERLVSDIHRLVRV